MITRPTTLYLYNCPRSHRKRMWSIIMFSSFHEIVWEIRKINVSWFIKFNKRSRSVSDREKKFSSSKFRVLDSKMVVGTTIYWRSSKLSIMRQHLLGLDSETRSRTRATSLELALIPSLSLSLSCPKKKERERERERELLKTFSQDLSTLLASTPVFCILHSYLASLFFHPRSSSSSYIVLWTNPEIFTGSPISWTKLAL